MVSSVMVSVCVIFSRKTRVIGHDMRLECVLFTMVRQPGERWAWAQWIDVYGIWITGFCIRATMYMAHGRRDASRRQAQSRERSKPTVASFIELSNNEINAYGVVCTSTASLYVCSCGSVIFWRPHTSIDKLPYECGWTCNIQVHQSTRTRIGQIQHGFKRNSFLQLTNTRILLKKKRRDSTPYWLDSRSAKN